MNIVDKAQLREVAVWQPQLSWKLRADGTTLIWRDDPLEEYSASLTDRIDHWAEHCPDRVWMAQRDGDGWRSVTYRELRQTVRCVAAWLLDRGVSIERPLIILSENSLEHAIIALSAQYVGIPSAAISPAYSLISEDFAKLRSIVGQITPGLVFVQSAGKFSRAIAATMPKDIDVVAVGGDVESHVCHEWNRIIRHEVSDAVDRAHAAITPDTVAKFLFTSGTTGDPKAVIQTNRMLCANQEMVRDCFAYMKDEPPVLCDWAPWNHTASGNKAFNLVLYNGGTFYIDEGKPTPAGIEATIRNLREISPTWYFNVPAGYEALVKAMQSDDMLRQSLFRDLKLMMYAGAGMAGHTWNELERLAQETTGQRILLSTGLGSTETAPFALFCTDPQDRPGNVGIPGRGVVMKLVPDGDKLELRLKGPNITPGYWRNEKLTREAFDEEGFYLLGDAVQYADPDDPGKGFYFDGRIAENFKLRTGTWVAVGPLRAKLVDQMGGLVRDAVIVGENEEALAALLVPDPAAMRKLARQDGSDSAIFENPEIREEISRRLAAHIREASGSATRVMRVMLLTEPLSLDRGEITDKGSVNQRAVLRNRADLAKSVFEDLPEVILPADKG